MDEPDLRRLRYFVVLAEELNFSRAAARLHLSQQSLSSAIARLEREVGEPLFDRSTRHVELTTAGRALVAPARTALAAAADAIAAAKIRHQVVGTVGFGLSSGARYGFEALFRCLADALPGVTVVVQHDSARPLLEQIRSGQLDLAAVFATRVPPDLESLHVRDEGLILAVTESHPLAGREQVSLAELREETFALDTPGHNPDYDAAVLDACRASGFVPRTLAHGGSHDTWEDGVHFHGCVGLTVPSALHAAHRRLRLVPLVEDVRLPVRLVWLERSYQARRPVRAVVEVARQLVAQEAGSS